VNQTFVQDPVFVCVSGLVMLYMHFDGCVSERL